VVGILSGMVTFALSFALKLKLVLNVNAIVVCHFCKYDSFCVVKYHSQTSLAKANKTCVGGGVWVVCFRLGVEGGGKGG